MRMTTTVAVLVLSVSGMGWGTQAAAQGVAAEATAQPAPAAQQTPSPAAAPAASYSQLPAAVTTAFPLPGSSGVEASRTYQATAGALMLRNAQGEPQVELSYVAYTLPGQAPARRPITFAFNGGPGAASAYLNLGAMGPQRLPFGRDGDTPSSPPVLVENLESWLPFTDLVFIDPVGTGYSRFARDDEALREQFWSVDGDVEQFARFIRQYLAEHGRMVSPKGLVGESYGGFRVPKVARSLQSQHGVGVSAIMMISPVLDFAPMADSALVPLGAAARLPSLAAVAMTQRGETPDRLLLQAAEAYASGEYLVDYLRGPRDAQAVERMVTRVTALTGLPRSVVAQQAGRLDLHSLKRAVAAETGRTVSLYDGNVTGLDNDPYNVFARPDDPILDASIAPVTSAAVDYLSRTLNYRVDAPYRLLNPAVGAGWQWGSRGEPPEALTDLRDALALDARLKAVIVHGYSDLVTPYVASQWAINQLPPLGGEDGHRVRLEVLPGGHMFYAREDSRQALTALGRAMYAPWVDETAASAEPSAAHDAAGAGGQVVAR